MALHDVELTQFIYPCLEYAKARAGLYGSFKDFENAERKPVPDDPADIPVGAILIWHTDDTPDWEQNFLTIRNGKVLAKWHRVTTHYCVHERDGYVSDLVVGDKDRAPYIRMRHLSDMTRKPCGMIVENIGYDGPQYTAGELCQQIVQTEWTPPKSATIDCAAEEAKRATRVELLLGIINSETRTGVQDKALMRILGHLVGTSGDGVPPWEWDELK